MISRQYVMHATKKLIHASTLLKQHQQPGNASLKSGIKMIYTKTVTKTIASYKLN